MFKRLQAAVQPKKSQSSAQGTFVPEVLMLDDESELTNVLKEFLDSNGFRVTTVKNGVEGLKKVMAQDYDVIVCDMLMPHLPGDMFFIAVQKVRPHLCERFIFMTGQKGDRKIDDFIRSVRGVMLWKPFQLHELMDTINFVIKRTKKNE